MVDNKVVDDSLHQHSHGLLLNGKQMCSHMLLELMPTSIFSRRPVMGLLSFLPITSIVACGLSPMRTCDRTSTNGTALLQIHMLIRLFPVAHTSVLPWSVREAKTIGLSVPSCRCERTAPIPYGEASQGNTRSCVGSK